MPPDFSGGRRRLSAPVNTGVWGALGGHRGSSPPVPVTRSIFCYPFLTADGAHWSRNAPAEQQSHAARDVSSLAQVAARKRLEEWLSFLFFPCRGPAGAELGLQKEAAAAGPGVPRSRGGGGSGRGARAPP